MPITAFSHDPEDDLSDIDTHAASCYVSISQTFSLIFPPKTIEASSLKLLQIAQFIHDIENDEKCAVKGATVNFCKIQIMCRA